MADNKEIIPRHYDLDAKWDACLDLTVRRFVYSSFAGAFGGLLLFSQTGFETDSLKDFENRRVEAENKQEDKVLEVGSVFVEVENSPCVTSASRSKKGYKLVETMYLRRLGSPQTRWASIAFGAGVGIGSAYTECSRLFDGPPTKLALPKGSDAPIQKQSKLAHLPLELPYLIFSHKAVN
ncbi:mitochondrial inner membrane organizing system protein 1-like [Trifolium pratense]|uniref:Mitochondrial inner membrane organizing system protein 1-like n=1 Tax=Trifolium pratense TaxID=57577 RepID=A0A2K3NX07_TRIPR|nr:mitochondrial inner membrane organizing system protein 1-like [Trifolium pratense]